MAAAATNEAAAAAAAALPDGIPDAMLIDGNPPAEGATSISMATAAAAGVPRGVKAVAYQAAADGLGVSVSLASILATHTRDALMVEADAGWPGYGFGTHRGHPTRKHLAALATRGPCAIHRRSCKPVKRAAARHGGAAVGQSTDKDVPDGRKKGNGATK